MRQWPCTPSQNLLPDPWKVQKVRLLHFHSGLECRKDRKRVSFIDVFPRRLAVALLGFLLAFAETERVRALAAWLLSDRWLD